MLEGVPQAQPVPMSRVTWPGPRPRAVKSAIRDLGHRRRWRRVKAALFLAAVGQRHAGRSRRAEPALMQALSDDSLFVRSFAANALIAIDRERPPEPLIERLRAAAGREGSGGAAAPDAEEIVELGLMSLRSLPLVEHFSEWLRSPDSARRWQGAIVLGGSGDERAIEPLARALVHDDGRVRGMVIAGLAQLGGPRAESHLTQVARSGKRRDRWRARLALWRLRRGW